MANGKYNILIIDDEPVVREALEALLAVEEYNITFACDGKEGLEIAAQLLPDVILLDVMMPEMDGYEVCQKLKSQPQLAYIPIIMVTALHEKDQIARGLNAGADEFLPKPVNGLELRARVRSMLRIRNHYRDFQATMQLREDLANMIVHDMRSPLTIILGYGESIKNDQDTPPRNRQRGEKIYIQAERMNTFLNDMLVIAKMEEGRLFIEPTLQNLNQILLEICQNYHLMAEERDITLITEIPENSIFTQVDSNLFIRVIDNLLSNAFKFAPSSSAIKIRLYQENNRESPLNVMQIIDEGPGIPQENRNDIFDKFKIVELKKQGLMQIGLGLAFCKMVVEAHHGDIRVEPNEPAGSIFTISLPATIE